MRSPAFRLSRHDFPWSLREGSVPVAADRLPVVSDDWAVITMEETVAADAPTVTLNSRFVADVPETKRVVGLTVTVTVTVTASALPLT